MKSLKEIKARLHKLYHELSGEDISIHIARHLDLFVEKASKEAIEFVGFHEGWEETTEHYKKQFFSEEASNIATASCPCACHAGLDTHLTD